MVIPSESNIADDVLLETFGSRVTRDGWIRTQA